MIQGIKLAVDHPATSLLITRRKQRKTVDGKRVEVSRVPHPEGWSDLRSDTYVCTIGPLVALFTKMVDNKALAAKIAKRIMHVQTGNKWIAI